MCGAFADAALSNGGRTGTGGIVDWSECQILRLYRKGPPPITSSTEAVVLHGTVQAFEELLNLAPGMDLWMASTSCNFEQYISAFNHSSEPPTGFGTMRSEVPVSQIQLLLPNLTSWPLTCEVPQWCSQEDEVDRPSTRPIWLPKNRHR